MIEYVHDDSGATTAVYDAWGVKPAEMTTTDRGVAQHTAVPQVHSTEKFDTVARSRSGGSQVTTARSMSPAVVTRRAMTGPGMSLDPGVGDGDCDEADDAEGTAVHVCDVVVLPLPVALKAMRRGHHPGHRRVTR